MKPSPFEILSREEIRYIDQESRRILEEAGVKVLHRRAPMLLEECGCKTDPSSYTVRIPSDVPDKAIEASPREFKLYGREPLPGSVFP